ncbi:bag-associated gram protein 1, partial [Quercus suber]
FCIYFVDGPIERESPNQFSIFNQDTALISFFFQLELLVAKNLIAANLNGTSDPYAIITCGTEKRFSSMVLSSRNPMWGEEFNFAVEELPIEVVIMIYDPYHSYSYGSKT